VVKRLYIDNFRTFSNFTLEFDAVNLLLGANGTGKSSVFSVLRSLQAFVGRESALLEAFPLRDISGYQTNYKAIQDLGLKSAQAFELDLQTPAGLFEYRLRVVFYDDFTKSKVAEEELCCDGKRLFFFQEGEAHLFRDDGTEGAVIHFDWEYSGVGYLQERKDNKKVGQFKRWLAGMVIVQPVPALMSAESRREAGQIDWHMENFASWYRAFFAEHQTAVVGLYADLAQSIPGFSALSFLRFGEEMRVLQAEFVEENAKKTRQMSFTVLSEGQKMLVALYALIASGRGSGVSVFIDEPDNYLSIEEIQPWLRSFIDDCGEGGELEQVVVISHHPEIIDYSGFGQPVWFFREKMFCTRTKPLEYNNPDDKRALPLSELIARQCIE
jgi:predicted ATPase